MNYKFTNDKFSNPDFDEIPQLQKDIQKHKRPNPGLSQQVNPIFTNNKTNFKLINRRFRNEIYSDLNDPNDEILLTRNRFINPKIGKQQFKINKLEKPLLDSKDENDITIKKLKEPSTISSLNNDSKEIRTYSKFNYDSKITKITINSKDRVISPINILSKNKHILQKNAFSFIKDSDILRIKDINHGYIVEDKIIIQNVISKFLMLTNPLEITANNVFIKINHKNHGFDLERFDLYDPVFIELSNVRGNIRDFQYINNLPVSLLNKKHQVFLIRDDKEKPNKDFYYIKLSLIIPDKNYTDGVGDVEDNNVKIRFLNLNGVPINNINANFPLNECQKNGFHVINKVVDEDNYEIILDTQAVDTINNIGNENILVVKVEKFVEGFPNPNSYKIELKKTFTNVKRIRILSTEIPNTQKVIRSNPSNKQNNSLCWQNLLDSDNIYSLEIPSGNYDHTTLEHAIKDAFESTERVDLQVEGDLDTKNRPISRNNFHIADIKINRFTDIVSIKLFQENVISKPIKLIPNNDPNVEIDTIEINHKNHQLLLGTRIRIGDAISTDGISATIINGEHIITRIVDQNNYQVELPLNNKLTDKTTTNGGIKVSILSPLQFKMFFNKNNTLGNILGFRNVGAERSVTPFVTEVRNNLPYDNELFINQVGTLDDIQTDTGSIDITDLDIDTTILRNNVVNLTGDDYILLTNPLFKETLDSSGVKNVMTKIRLNRPPGTILFDSFIQTQDIFDPHIAKITNLEFTFRSPDGTLFDFTSKNHSMTLEIVEDLNDLSNSQLSSRTGMKGRTIL